jgi:Phage integrase family
MSSRCRLLPASCYLKYAHSRLLALGSSRAIAAAPVIVELATAWEAICKAAGIKGLRVHDLRHSFASQLASGGASLPLIGALLGHSNPTTTARYAHLFQDPLRAAVEKVGAVIGAVGKPAVEPTPIKRGAEHGRRRPYRLRVCARSGDRFTRPLDGSGLKLTADECDVLGL